MEFPRVFLAFGLAIGGATLAEARTAMRRVSGNNNVEALKRDDHQHAKISPELEPKSDKKFFHKDYPWDERPKADPFHFHHPYPAVQDSGDYDTDFVKDENKDNGNWKAQETYDRLRTKLARQKRDLAKALEKKRKEDKELKDAMERQKQEERAKDEAKKKADEVEKDREEHKVKTDKQKAKSASNAAPKKKGEGETQTAGTEVKGVDAASDQTKHAVDKLEECKKELAAARKKLEKLMNELDAAKAAQAEANAALDTAASRELKSEEEKSSIAGKVHDEYDEYLKAKEAYEKQQAVVAKLKRELTIAASKVKNMRDAESKTGGVYPTPEEKTESGAAFLPIPKLLVLAFVGLIASL